MRDICTHFLTLSLIAYNYSEELIILNKRVLKLKLFLTTFYLFLYDHSDTFRNPLELISARYFKKLL